MRDKQIITPTIINDKKFKQYKRRRLRLRGNYTIGSTQAHNNNNLSNPGAWSMFGRRHEGQDHTHFLFRKLLQEIG